MIELHWINAKQVGAGMLGVAEAIGTHHGPHWGEEVAEAGEAAVQRTVLSGGINKPRTTYGARIKTGAMFDSAEGISRGGDASASVRAGFINGPPRWTKFQERGTRGNHISTKNPRPKPTKSGGGGSGVPAMLAIPQAEIEMKAEALEAGTRMLMNIKAEWDAI